MSAKEERALHLEIHRMNRAHNELLARNAALESECARLRTGLNHECAKLVANHDALLQKCAAYQAAEHEMLSGLQMERREMMAAMQREQNETLSRMRQQMQQEALAHKHTVTQTMEAHYADIIGKKTQDLDAAKQALADELMSEKKARIRREEEALAHKHTVTQTMEARYADIIGKKTQELDAAKQALADELMSEKKRREEEHVAYFWTRVEEVNNLKAAKMQKWEEDKRILQEEWQQRLDQATNQRMQVEARLELEKSERAHAESQMNHYMSVANEYKRKLEKEQTELAAATERRFEERVQTLTVQLIKTVSFSKISHAIAANYAHTQRVYSMGFRGKRVLLYSHYSDRDEVESYNYLTLQHMEGRFDYIVVLTNCPNKWDPPNPNYNKYHVLWYNFKSDFRNYAMFITQSAKTLVHASQLCLMNDSCVMVDVLAYERCMERVFEPAATHDFAGITSSHEGVFHLQSYFMLFNSSVIKAVVHYFGVHGLPINHNASISVYELGITQHLMGQGFTPYAVVSNAEMQFPLNTTYYKWSAVLQQAGIIKRQHLLKQYPARFAMTDYNIALVAHKFSENTHFIHYLKYHGINLD
jgi:hypothetical protein